MYISFSFFSSAASTAHTYTLSLHDALPISQFRSAGPESWHPSPDFLFQRGAGPLYDMGPYYLTSLVLAYGPVASVSAVGSQRSEEHTSELQSRGHLVCRLLLEKKKNDINKKLHQQNGE